MNRIAVQSSNLTAIGYDVASRTLEVEFKNGSVYQYFEVPDRIYEAMVGLSSSGGSVGRYFDQHVKRAGFRWAKK